jgi:hypothetical protein
MPARVACLALMLAFGALAGCGGATEGASKAGPTPGGPATGTQRSAAVPASPGAQSAPARVVQPLPGAIHSSAKQPKVGGERELDSDEVQSTGADALNPCTLVTRSEASSILPGRLQAAVEAPLGPTCIYKTKSGKFDVTVAVPAMAFKPPRATKPGAEVKVKLHGRTGWCVQRGRGLTFVVPLAGGRALSIAGPCPIAAAFAAKALPRLPD